MTRRPGWGLQRPRLYDPFRRIQGNVFALDASPEQRVLRSRSRVRLQKHVKHPLICAENRPCLGRSSGPNGDPFLIREKAEQIISCSHKRSFNLHRRRVYGRRFRRGFFHHGFGCRRGVGGICRLHWGTSATRLRTHGQILPVRLDDRSWEFGELGFQCNG